MDDRPLAHRLSGNSTQLHEGCRVPASDRSIGRPSARFRTKKGSRRAETGRTQLDRSLAVSGQPEPGATQAGMIYRVVVGIWRLYGVLVLYSVLTRDPSSPPSMTESGEAGRTMGGKASRRTSRRRASGIIQGNRQSHNKTWATGGPGGQAQQGVLSIGNLLTCRLNRFQGPT